MRLARFRPGQSTFTCKSCTRLTRETSTNSVDGICEDCYELAGLENGVADGHPVGDYLSEAVERYTRIKSKGGTYGFWTELGDAVLTEIDKPKLETEMKAKKVAKKTAAALVAEAPAPASTGSILTETEVKEAAGGNGASQAPVAPLTQAKNTRKALDEAIKAKIIEALKKPAANMTKIASEHGVSYGVVQNLKAKMNKTTPRPDARRTVAPKLSPKAIDHLIAEVDDIELMRLELDFLRKKVALLESRKS
jgi:transposase-like protein